MPWNMRAEALAVAVTLPIPIREISMVGRETVTVTWTVRLPDREALPECPLEDR